MNTAEAKLLANQLIQKHLVEEQGIYEWEFHFDSAVRRLGCCNHTRKIISLSFDFVLLNREELVRDTILHEIAHAIEGPAAGHGTRWRAKMLGCHQPTATCIGQGLIKPKFPYLAVCTNCGMKKPALRRQHKPVACRNCCLTHNEGKYDERFSLSFEVNV